jgi:ketosteroid isomerase-like protein
VSEQTTILVDGEEIYAARDAAGMIITYTDECPVIELSKMLIAARDAGLDMKEQWFDVDASRHVLTFGDVEGQ